MSSISLDSAWSMYMAIRVHYMDNGYDVVEAKGRLVNQKSLQNRPDKILLRASLLELKDMRQVVEYCAANFLSENDNFLYDSVDDADGYFSSWKSFWQAPERNLRNCATQIELSMYKNSCLSFDEYVEKQLFKDIYLNKVNRETLCVIGHQNPGLLEKMTGFEKDRLVSRVAKTNRLIEGRLKRMKVNFREMVEESLT